MCNVYVGGFTYKRFRFGLVARAKVCDTIILGQHALCMKELADQFANGKSTQTMGL